ncbi:MAG: magnesium transporter [Termitinemataceae bacterium]|nr:MAG: magnesium transporter [Termitinemataceae bacterium]
MKNLLLELMFLEGAEIVDAGRLKTLLPQMNTADIAEALDELPKEKSIQLFCMLSKAQAADVFSYIGPDKQQTIIEALADSEIAEIMNRIFADDAVDFIEEMPAAVVTRVLRNVSPEKRRVINQLLRYPDDSAGSVMTIEFVELSEDSTVAGAFDEIRAHGVNKETIYTCYVIRKDRTLVGVVSAKKLLLAGPGERIGSIMDTKLVFAHTHDDQEAVAREFQKYNLLAMPVVDNEKHLVGIITVDDVMEIIEEENTEDFEKMNALAPSDDPYLKTSILRLAKNRIVWLLVLMLSATITGSIIGGFEDALAALPVLVVFIPMLMDTGGNAGSQSSTLIIRGMAVGEIRLRDIAKVLWREVRIGSICGVALGLINMARIYFMNGHDILLAVTVTVSLFATVLMAKSVGCILPMVAKKLRIDPAIMAAPLITTIVDASSLIIYFSVAKLVLNM